MAYEAAVRGPRGRRGPGGADRGQPVAALRAAQALGHPGPGPRARRGRPPLDVGGHPGALLDAFALAAALTAAGGPPALVVAADHLVSLRGARRRHPLGRRRRPPSWSAPRAASPAWARRRAPGARSTTSGAWAPSPRPRYRLEVLFDAYATTTTEALAGLERAHRAADRRLRGRLREPAPPPDPARAGQGGASAPSSSRAPASSARSATWARPRSGWRWRSGLDRAAPGDHLLALGYGGGEAIAQDVEVTGATRRERARRTSSPGEAIDLSTYYRWTRGRQAEPH